MDHLLSMEYRNRKETVRASGIARLSS